MIKDREKFKKDLIDIADSVLDIENIEDKEINEYTIFNKVEEYIKDLYFNISFDSFGINISDDFISNIIIEELERNKHYYINFIKDQLKKK